MEKELKDESESLLSWNQNNLALQSEKRTKSFWFYNMFTNFIVKYK